MKRIATILAAMTLACIAIAPKSASAESVVRTQAPASDFHKFLPPLPADVPWLTASAATSVKGPTLPEAGSVSALMFAPKPAEAWGSLTSQPVSLRPAGGCSRC